MCFVCKSKIGFRFQLSTIMCCCLFLSSDSSFCALGIGLKNDFDYEDTACYTVKSAVVIHHLLTAPAFEAIQAQRQSFCAALNETFIQFRY